METNLNTQLHSIEYLSIKGKNIAYQVMGQGPLVIMSPGIADTRAAYRFLAPLIANAGYRVASVDLRGHGDSSTNWDSYNHIDTANDLIELTKMLGGPAIIIGQSFSAGAATIAAATHPDQVSAIVEIGPFTRPPKISLKALLNNAHNYRRGAFLLAGFVITGNVKYWLSYLDVAYPVHKPADWRTWLTTLEINLKEPGRIKAAQTMVNSKKTLQFAGMQLAHVQCPTLVLMGNIDSDFPDPEAEAAAIVDLLPTGLGHYQMIKNAGHYPHAQYPHEVADAILSFLAKHIHA